ncbi:MAG: alpha/beta fold hydrolase [Acidimicrobiia bacterium]
MATCTTTDGLTIGYETIGDRNAPAGPLLLVQGLGATRHNWRDEWCAALLAAGHFVIRFDNRDCGRSSHLEGVRVDLTAVMAAWNGVEGAVMPAVPYLLSDMAADAVAVLDHLGLERAHVVGASLGGMIAQAIAIEHPERVLTLTSIMSTTGDRATYQSDPAVRALLFAPQPTEREALVRTRVETMRALGSPRHFDAVDAERFFRWSLDNDPPYPEGILRQTAAIRASGARDDALRRLDVPALVIHGADDRLILPVAGAHTADCLPGSRFLLVKDMGHDLPRPLWPILVDAIASHARHRI